MRRLLPIYVQFTILEGEMKKWMRVLPRPVRHVLICKLSNRYATYCMGHRGVLDRDAVVRYGTATP